MSKEEERCFNKEVESKEEDDPDHVSCIELSHELILATSHQEWREIEQAIGWSHNRSRRRGPKYSSILLTNKMSERGKGGKVKNKTKSRSSRAGLQFTKKCSQIFKLSAAKENREKQNCRLIQRNWFFQSFSYIIVSSFICDCR